MSKFNECLKIILKHEGGYVNHPKDPGGITNLGVTKKVFEEWVGHEVTADTMRSLTEDNVAPIYKRNYWDKLRCDELPEGVDLCVFDFGVNAGTGRAAKYLQRIVGTTVDGGIGPNSIRAVNNYLRTHSTEDLIEHFQKDRADFYRRLSTFDTFGRGWIRRVDETTELALNMV